MVIRPTSHQDKMCKPVYLPGDTYVNFDTAMYPTVKVSWCLYPVLVNDAE